MARSSPEGGKSENQPAETESPTLGSDSLPSEAEPESASQPAEAEGGSVADPEQACKKLLEEKKETYDRLLRKQAELDNFRKRMTREKEEFLQYAGESLVRELLPVVDGFERALRSSNDNVPEEYYRGIELLYRELSDVLSRAGMTEVKAKGKVFDPHLHQAVETLESADYGDHEILEEFQRGYKFKDRLLRPSLVKVAVPPAGTTNGPDKDTEESEDTRE